jgi:lysozyme
MTYRPIPAGTIPFVKTQEGGVFRVYDDKNPNRILTAGMTVEGVLTGGWGHTGKDVQIGMDVTRPIAETWLASDLVNKSAIPIYNKIGDAVNNLTENQYIALLDFVFNLGDGDHYVNGKFVPSNWPLWDLLKKGQYDQVPAHMSQYVNWNGVKSNALQARRNRETELWATGEPGTVAEAPPSSVTQREPTPPTPSDPVPPQKSTTIIGGLITVGSSVGVAVSQITNVISPFSESAPMVGKVIATMATVAAVAAVIVLAANWLKKNKDRTGHWITI